jgi:WD40 repeat protein
VVFTLRGRGDFVPCVGFSRDGHRVFAGSMDGTVTIWDGTPGP